MSEHDTTATAPQYTAAQVASVYWLMTGDGARPEQIDLSGVVWRGADLRYANLRGADLRDADLSEASLSGALMDQEPSDE